MKEIANELNAALDEYGGSGTFKVDAGKVFWYYSDNGDADTDHLWEIYCEASEIVSKVSDHYEIANSWNDNDSCGFDLEIKNNIEYSGWDAVGKPVPAIRLQNAQRTVEELLPDADNKTVHSIVARCAEHIKRNELWHITEDVTSLDNEIGKIDLTGRYRLLAVLLN